MKIGEEVGETSTVTVGSFWGWFNNIGDGAYVVGISDSSIGCEGIFLNIES